MHVTETGLRINGGFFVLSQRVFDYMEPGDELMGPPATRMSVVGELGMVRHDGFWACMDTFKEKRLLEDIYQRGDAPWEVWKPRIGGPGDVAVGAPLIYGSPCSRSPTAVA